MCRIQKKWGTDPVPGITDLVELGSSPRHDDPKGKSKEKGKSKDKDKGKGKEEAKSKDKDKGKGKEEVKGKDKDKGEGREETKGKEKEKSKNEGNKEKIEDGREVIKKELAGRHTKKREKMDFEIRRDNLIDYLREIGPKRTGKNRRNCNVLGRCFNKMR